LRCGVTKDERNTKRRLTAVQNRGERNVMTPSNYLLIAAVTVVTLSTSHSVRADEPLLRYPKNHVIQVVPGSSVGDPDLLKDRPSGNAKAWELARSLRKLPNLGSSVDLVHSSRPTMSPKDPRFETAWRENAGSQFQNAPLK